MPNSPSVSSFGKTVLRPKFVKSPREEDFDGARTPDLQEHDKGAALPPARQISPDVQLQKAPEDENRYLRVAPTLSSQLSSHLETASKPVVVETAEKAITNEYVQFSAYLEAILHRLDLNLKYTKAVYRSTKKSLTGPGFEANYFGDLMSQREPDESSPALSKLTHVRRAGLPHVSEAPLYPSSASSPNINRTFREVRSTSFASSHTNTMTETSREKFRVTRTTSSIDSSMLGTSFVFDDDFGSGALGGNARHGGEASTNNLPHESRQRELSDFGGHAGNAGDANPAHLKSVTEEVLEPEDVLQETPSSIASKTLSTSSRLRSRGRPTMRDVFSSIAQQNSHHKSPSAKLWRFMEDRTSSHLALYYFRGRMLLVAMSVLFACFQVVEVSKEATTQDLTDGVVGDAIQLSIEMLFAVEFGVRFLVCPNRPVFLLSVYNVIDLMSILPCIVRLPLLMGFESGYAVVALFGIVPVLRLLKVLRHFETFHLLLNAFVSAVEALPMLLFILFLIASTFAAIIYFCEDRENIPSLPLAIYFSIVTVSTVGYGDFVAQSTAGRVWTLVLAIIGPMYMAIPIGIIGNAFSEVWQDRHRLLVLLRMRRCVTNAGYTAKDLSHMFKLIDTNGDEALDYDEFICLLQVMEIHVSDRFVRQVFASFDSDDTGAVDMMELIRGLFPHTYRRMTVHRGGSPPTLPVVSAALSSGSGSQTPDGGQSQ